jgi:CheY-like chemotaxis protein
VIRGEQPGSDGDPRRTNGGESLPSIAVLIVDDDEDTRDMIAVLLEQAGYSVATAGNGREALERLKMLRPEMILLDVCMPEMDGAMFRQEQRRHWDWLHIPTIVMTGAADEPMLDIAVEQTLRKPVRGADLLAIVARHCTSRVPPT